MFVQWTYINSTDRSFIQLLMKMEFDSFGRKMMFISRWCTNFELSGNRNEIDFDTLQISTTNGTNTLSRKRGFFLKKIKWDLGLFKPLPSKIQQPFRRANVPWVHESHFISAFGRRKCARNVSTLDLQKIKPKSSKSNKWFAHSTRCLQMRRVLQLMTKHQQLSNYKLNRHHQRRR